MKRRRRWLAAVAAARVARALANRLAAARVAAARDAAASRISAWRRGLVATRRVRDLAELVACVGGTCGCAVLLPGLRGDSKRCRLVSTEYPRPSQRRRRDPSPRTSRPRGRRDSSPRNIHVPEPRRRRDSSPRRFVVAAAAPSRFIRDISARRRSVPSKRTAARRFARVGARVADPAEASRPTASTNGARPAPDGLGEVPSGHRRGIRGGVEIFPSPSPQDIDVAAAASPRPASAEHPRRGRGATATRLLGTLLYVLQ